MLRKFNPNFGRYNADYLYRNYTKPLTGKMQPGNVRFYDYEDNDKMDRDTTIISRTEMTSPSGNLTSTVKHPGKIKQVDISYWDKYTTRGGGISVYRQWDWQKIMAEGLKKHVSVHK